MTEPVNFTVDLLGLPIRVTFTPDAGPGLHRYDFRTDDVPSPFSLIGHRVHIAFHEAVAARGIEVYAAEYIAEQAAHRLLR
jgi:hypothetical protein